MQCGTWWHRGGRHEESKNFFFEKKKQKTFGPLRACVAPAGPTPTGIKVFLLLFVHKKKFFLP
jgi:hypothetical protein